MEQTKGTEHTISTYEQIVQLYVDIQQQTRIHSHLLVSQEIALIYNALLAQVRMELPQDPIVNSIQVADGLTTYGAILVSVGQLKQILDDGPGRTQSSARLINIRRAYGTRRRH